MGAAPRNQPGRRAAAAPSAPGSTLGLSVGTYAAEAITMPAIPSLPPLRTCLMTIFCPCGSSTVLPVSGARSNGTTNVVVRVRLFRSCCSVRITRKGRTAPRDYSCDRGRASFQSARFADVPRAARILRAWAARGPGWL